MLLSMMFVKKCSSLYGGQFTLSTPLITPTFCIQKTNVFKQAGFHRGASPLFICLPPSTVHRLLHVFYIVLIVYFVKSQPNLEQSVISVIPLQK